MNDAMPIEGDELMLIYNVYLKEYYIAHHLMLDNYVDAWGDYIQYTFTRQFLMENYEDIRQKLENDMKKFGNTPCLVQAIAEMLRRLPFETRW